MNDLAVSDIHARMFKSSRKIAADNTSAHWRHMIFHKHLHRPSNSRCQVIIGIRCNFAKLLPALRQNISKFRTLAFYVVKEI